MAYLTLTTFKLITTMPASFVDQIETLTPGWVDAKCAVISGSIDTRLNKRYACPFGSPAPLIVQEWMERLLTYEAWLKRGVQSNDEQWKEVAKLRDQANSEIKEAADAVNGLFDLPLLASGVGGSAIVKGMPKAYSEQSPYVGMDQQRRVGVNEDQSGGGTFT
jgi:hypothetical protein